MMTFRGRFIAVALAACVATATARDTCLYNSTHCACSHKPTTRAGLCLHHTEGAAKGKCIVESCNSDNYICNCDGTDLCEYKKCGAWKMTDTSVDVLALGSTGVDCAYVKSGKCLTKLSNSAIPFEFKMVQIGDERTVSNMFNMTFQVDKDDAMTTSFRNGKGDGLHGLWPDVNTLKSRQLNFRLYQGDSDPNSKFVCMVINSWQFVNDKAPNYRVATEISAENGGAMKWMQCDDLNHSNDGSECQAPTETGILHASHFGMGIYSDGWCAGLLLENTVSIRLSGIENLVGMNFLGSDGAVSEYLFADMPGFKGELTEDGWAKKNGSIPEIKINLAGIEVELEDASASSAGSVSKAAVRFALTE